MKSWLKIRQGAAVCWRDSRVYGLLSGSFFAGWLVEGGAGEARDYAGGSAAAAVVSKVIAGGMAPLYRVGGWLARVLSGSTLTSRPQAWAGALALALAAFVLSGGHSRLRLALALLLALGGICLLAVKDAGALLSSSYIMRIFYWWKSTDWDDGVSGEEAPAVRALAAPEVYLVVLYAVLDWFFRQGAFSFMAGIWDELLFIAVAGLWVLRAGIHRLKPRGSRLAVPILVYFAVMVFLVLYNSPDNAVAIEGMRVMVEFIFWVFVAYNLVRTREQARGLADAFLLVCLLVALYGIWQYHIGVEMPTTWLDSKVETSIKTRVFSIVGSPNILGSLLMMALPIAGVQFLATRHWFKRVVYGGSGLVMALCLVLTYSRGAWLALVVAAVLVGCWVDRRVILGMILVALMTPVLMPSVYHRVAYMTTPEYQASSERGGRIGRWDKALAYWETKPEVGVGLGRFGGAVANRHYPEEAFYVDNWYLKVGTETGWVGLISTLLLFLLALREGRRSVDATRDRYLKMLGLGILAGLAGVLAHNAVENVFEVPMMATYWWFFAGLLLALPEEVGHG